MSADNVYISIVNKYDFGYIIDEMSCFKNLDDAKNLLILK